ncbi:MAG: cobalamin-dependent protein [Senegalia sp. (in: firmicutes)]|uniref:cobalamin-dependent protein n=1 Tax=Senegalia sp. (in: firmicutes) TaxID=1924098 RepID=UPI003F9DC29C
MNIFGKRIKKLRKKYELTQKKLAGQLGIGQTTIANYENGSRFPNPNILKSFADFFNVSIDYLVGRTESVEITNSSLISFNTENDIDYNKVFNSYFIELRSEDILKAKNILLQLVKANVKLEDIYFNIIQKSLIKVGNMWEKNKISIGEEHYFTEATKRIMSEIYFEYKTARPKDLNALFLSTHGERHSIGIRMISDVLEQDGWFVYFLGTDLPIDSIMKMIKDKDIDLIAISTTMDYNINSIKSMITNIRLSNNKKNIKFLVGGQPFNTDDTLCEFVGADGYAKNCKEVITVANNLVQDQKASNAPKSPQII